MLGTYGMYADQIPTAAGAVAYPGFTDKYLDVAVDAQYQYIGPIHAFTARAYYIMETQRLDATFFGSGGTAASKPDQWLNSLNISASYIYDRHVSFTANYFDVQGSDDATYWQGVFGQTNYNVGRPNTNGFTFDLAYIPYPYGGPDIWPWLNARIGVLYTHFDKFNGASTNYDGMGRNARDNDQTFVYSWIDF